MSVSPHSPPCSPPPCGEGLGVGATPPMIDAEKSAIKKAPFGTCLRAPAYPAGRYPTWPMRPTTTRMFRTRCAPVQSRADDMLGTASLSSRLSATFCGLASAWKEQSMVAVLCTMLSLAFACAPELVGSAFLDATDEALPGKDSSIHSMAA